MGFLLAGVGKEATAGGGGGTPYTHIQSQQSGGASPAAMAYASNTTAGNTLIVGATWVSLGTPTISDTRGNTWVLAATVNDGTVTSAIWVGTGGTTGANTVTLTLASQQFDCTLSEYAGLSAVDKVASATATGATPSSGATATTTQGNEMVYGHLSTNNNSSTAAGAGFTLRATGISANAYAKCEDMRVTATGAQTATFSTGTSQTYRCLCVTLKETGG